jgi:RHS repeat-associated protein
VGLGDAAGNVLYDYNNYYAYNGDGQLCAVQTVPYSGGTVAYGYLYDAEGRRVAKGTIATSANPLTQPLSCNPATNGFTLTESYVLDQGGEQLTTLNQSNAWQRTNVYGAGKLLATYDTAGLHFQLADPLGTRRLQTNAAAEPELDCQSLPFGDQQYCFPDPNAPASADDATPLHFTGKERDAESGLDYFGARYYGSSMGRFMSPDWAAKAEPVPYSKLDNPQSLNLYSYVYNNPLSKADPDGHCAEDACVVEGGTALVVGGIAIVAGTEAYLSTPSGQRSLSTFTSGVSSSFSNSVSSIKNFFSSSKATPAAPVGATPATPTAAPAVPGTQSNQPKSNPMTGTPGSTSQTTQPDGSPKQVRRYGPDGHPKTDVDHGHDHGQGDPHAHDWGRPSDGSAPTHTDRGPGRPVTPNDPKPQ